ncbi:hypothetical protein Acr_14g0009800 [Actinidia rufa]|uniref:KIB1-4 beta-propeller domain-containing protein n=1 Tax=Actinidia rufa TaxID=165716 RepID=A0A7J0FRM0_9ERIC|nr:hypothetical protein Acr_14g0009800 [Actinidia rufa]
MADWAKLLPDILSLIARRIHLFEDFIAFRGVCKPWRAVAVKKNFNGPQQIPWLMLAEDDNSDQRRFVNLTMNNKIRRVTLPEARGKKCFESRGWLVTVAQDGDMNLLNPFSRAQVSLPHISTLNYYTHEEGDMGNIFMYVNKAVLSSSPDESSDYVVMVIDKSGWLAFCRSGDETWTTIEPRGGSFFDIAYYKGNFYAVALGGKIFVCDIGGSNSALALNVGQVPTAFLYFHVRSYLAESAGALLVIVRDGYQIQYLDEYDEDPDFDINNPDESRIDYGTHEFHVFELDLNEGRWTEKESLSDNALFVGDNASICIDVSRFPGIKANCIYYTDDCWPAYLHFNRGGGKDMGIYNLEDGSITPLYSGQSFSPITPPMWVTPSL